MLHHMRVSISLKVASMIMMLIVHHVSGWLKLCHSALPVVLDLLNKLLLYPLIAKHFFDFFDNSRNNFGIELSSVFFHFYKQL